MSLPALDDIQDRSTSFVVLTQHRVSFDLDIFRQILCPLVEKALQEGSLVVNIPILAASPVFIEYEHIRIVVCPMKVIVNATGFLPGLRNKILQDFLDLLHLLGLRVEIRNHGAHIVHVNGAFRLRLTYSSYKWSILCGHLCSFGTS